MPWRKPRQDTCDEAISESSGAVWRSFAVACVDYDDMESTIGLKILFNLFMHIVYVSRLPLVFRCTIWVEVIPLSVGGLYTCFILVGRISYYYFTYKYYSKLKNKRLPFISSGVIENQMWMHWPSESNSHAENANQNPITAVSLHIIWN